MSGSYIPAFDPSDSLASLGKTLGGAVQTYRQRQSLAGLGEKLKSGDYAGAASDAVSLGDLGSAQKFLEMGQKAQRDADARGIVSGLGGGSLASLGAPPQSVGQPFNLPGGPPQTNGTANVVAQEFLKRGYSPVAVAGILGNFQRESSMNPSVMDDAGTSGGLGQWHNERLSALKQFSQQQGMDWRDPLAQVAFTDHELRTSESNVFQRLQAAKTPREAATAFMDYERPAGWTRTNPLGGLAAAERLAAADQFAGLPSINSRVAAPPQNGTAPAGAPGMGGLPNLSLAQILALQQSEATKGIGDAYLKRMMESQGTIAISKGGALVDRATGRVVYSSPGDPENKPQSVREYEYARQNGFSGSYADFLSRNQKPATDPGGKIADEARARRDLVVQQGGDPKDPRNLQFINTGKYPREDTQPLSAADKNAIIEADDMVAKNESALNALRQAKALSRTAFGFPGAGYAASAGALVGNEQAQATIEMDNLITGQALDQLKAIFGGAPTEGERAILMQVQGSSGQPDAVRQKIFDRAIAAATRRLEFNRQRAEQLRGGTYFKPGGATPTQPPAASAESGLPAGWSVEVH